ncbi:MAG: AAA family ATPase [Phycisphaerae bacterium]|nr:AAA family ATPase [Phycisphaerae bacterium]
MTGQKEDSARLEQLIRGMYPCVVIGTVEEDHALSTIREAVIRTPSFLNIWTIVDGLRDGLVADQTPIPETVHPSGALYYLLRQENPGINVFLDLAAHLRDDRTMRLLREVVEHCRNQRGMVILVDHNGELPLVIESVATRFEISLPDSAEIESLLRESLRQANMQDRIEVDLNRRTLQLILRNLRGLTRRQIRQIIQETVVEDRRFDADDLALILARKRQAVQGRGLLEFIETPEDLSAIGGLKRLKRWLEIRREVFTDEASRFGLTAPRGILLLGVQGAGKSFCAKAIATAWKRPLLRLDVGSLYDRFIGESERNLRDALHQAEMMSPIILWIDEVEKAFASAASRSADGGLSQRMFGALLTWMQEHRAPVFLVATANDIEALPPELLRKGRFDEIFFVDLPSPDTRREILAIHLRRRGRDPNQFDMDALINASEGYTGAEIEQAIVSALHEAFAAKKEIDTGRVVTALQMSPPLSVIQMERVADLRAWASARCLPAD